MNCRAVFGALSAKNSMVIGPAAVSSTARYPPSSGAVSVDERLGGRVAERDVVDRDAFGRDTLVVHRHLRDLLQYLDAVGHLPEYRVLVVERRLIGEDDEELRAGTIGPSGHQHRGHRTACHLRRARFRLDEVLPAGAVERALRRILAERIAPLHHPEPHGAMEDRAIVAAVRRELHEIRGLTWRRLRQQVDDECALARLDDGLLRPGLSDHGPAEAGHYRSGNPDSGNPGSVWL